VASPNVELPDGAQLEDGEVVIKTAKDWGLSIKSLVLTNRRLFCPADLTMSVTVSLPLTDVLGVTLQKHMIGFSTILVDARNRPQSAFPAHINGKLVRSDIAAAVERAKQSAALDSSTTSASRSTGDRYDQLRKITELRQSGTLSEAEFEEEKARILKQP
jgi:hypothetical protein